MTEDTVSFGVDSALWGVIARPDPSVRSEWGVVLLNAGLVHRVGPHRMYVDLARLLTERGLPVLRFDLSGVGDSEPRADYAPFELTAVEEAQAAMDWLQEHSTCRRFILAGLCSGAEVAFKTACRDARVAGAVLINASRYEQEPDAELLARVEQRQRAHRQMRVAIYDWGKWKRLLTGRVDYRGTLQSLSQSVLDAIRGTREPTAAFNPDVEGFAELERRGVRVLLLFSEADWGLDYMATVLGNHLDERCARGHLRLETIEASDHTFTPLASRETAVSAILEWVRTCTADAGSVVDAA